MSESEDLCRMAEQSGEETTGAPESARQSEPAGLFSGDTDCDDLYRRLAALEAVRRSDLEVTRNVSGATAWYLVHDPVTFRHHRMSASDYQMFAEIQPERSLGVCFQRLVAKGALKDADADRFFGWIVQLHRLGVISLPIETGSLLHRRSVEKRRIAKRFRLTNILFYRLPLFSPDAFLHRTVKLVAPLFSRLAVVIWLLAMLFCGTFVWQHLSELADPFRYASASQSAVLMVILLVVLKGVHEFGHAFACRHFGGAVPEMGVFFIVFTPCAYIDASASWGFRQRHRRIAVALAGMYFESIAAMGALLLWSCSDPSLIKAAAHQALLLATVVTVGFNINPLMKFDGYYVLADLLGIPQLRGDAISEWKRCVRRILYGVSTPSLAATRRGSLGLAVFGCCVVVYKLTVILGISLLIVELPLIGPPLGLFFILSFCWQKLWKFVRYTVSSRELESCRLRAGTVAVLAASAVFGVILHVPSPEMTAAHGILRYQFHETLYAPGHGRLESLDVIPGQTVDAGQPVCRLVSSGLQQEEQYSQAALAAALLDVRSSVGESPAEYAAAVAKYCQQESRHRLQAEEMQAQTLVAPVQGQVIQSDLLLQSGVWVEQGTAVAVIGHGLRVVDAVISEEATDGRLPDRGDIVEVRVEGCSQRLANGEVLEVSPVARNEVPIPALASQFGGPVESGAALDESKQAWFSIRVLLSETGEVPVFDGVRAVVKINAERPPVGVSVYRACCRFRDSFLMAN